MLVTLWIVKEMATSLSESAKFRLSFNLYLKFPPRT